MSISNPIAPAFERYGTTTRYQAGKRLFCAGDEGDACYLVEVGIVRIQLDAADIDSDAILRFVEAGEIIGEMAILDAMPRSASAYAETDVTVRELTRSAIDKIAEVNPKLAYDTLLGLGRLTSTKLRSLTQSYANCAYKPRDNLADQLIGNASQAQLTFAAWPDTQVEDLLIELATSLAGKARYYAKLTVNCTGVGNIQDKAVKNRLACLGILGEILKAGDPVNPDGERPGVTAIASACGVIFGVIPMTSPVATAIFKILIALHGRNAIVLSPHRAALPVCRILAEEIDQILIKNAAPQGLVSWVLKRADRRRTNAFMKHKGVALVLATGGKMLVEAAYQSGKPAFGVGPGNAPVLIADDADLANAARHIVRSKSFDNGLICGAENNLLINKQCKSEFAIALQQAGAALLDQHESATLLEATLTASNHLSSEVIGQNADNIASMVGIARDYPIKLLVVPQTLDDANSDNRLAKEKLAPIVSMFCVGSNEEGFELAQTLLRLDGNGHTAIIHTRSDELANRFAQMISASRILVNTPAVQGIVGATTGLMPSLTLGCGTFGGNSSTDNINHRHMVNLKRLAFHNDEGEAMLDSMDHVNPAATLLSRVLGFDAPEAQGYGCVVRDTQGKEYLDFLAGVGVMNVGHRHPRVTQAVKDQLDKMPFTSRVMINPLQAKLAKRLAAIAPGNLSYSFFSNSGTEAVEAALKIARFSTGRNRIISTTNSFHGKTYGSLSASGREIFKTPFSPMVPGFEQLAFGDIDSMEQHITDDVAAVILEPIQGEGGINIAPPGYLRAIRKRCDQVGALMILDEVQTGIGRCGSMFVCEQENVIPDLLCLAKGLSGGVIPIGVTMGTPQVWTIFEENAFLHSSTFGGNPLACCAAMATLDVVQDENLCANASEMGEYLLESIAAISREAPGLIVEVRGRGLLIGIEFSNENTCARIIAGVVEQGVIAGYTLNQPTVIRLEPPLIVSKDQCAVAIDALRKSILAEFSRHAI